MEDNSFHVWGEDSRAGKRTKPLNKNKRLRHKYKTKMDFFRGILKLRTIVSYFV